MIENQRGGIISSMFMIPIGITLMIGFFFLGYYVGKYQSKSGKQDQIVLPLPEVVSKNLPKEEFTFYKTLTDKGNKTVSIDLKPKNSAEEKNKVKPDTDQAENKNEETKKDRKADLKTEKTKAVAVKQPEQKKQIAKKDPEPARAAGQKIRYSLQIASYPQKEMAEEDVKKMKQHGYAAFIVSSDLEGKGVWYRVRVGSFSNRSSAEKLQKELRTKEGMTPIITIE